MATQKENSEIKAVFFCFAVAVLILLSGAYYLNITTAHYPSQLYYFMWSGFAVLAMLVPLLIMFNHCGNIPVFISTSLKDSLVIGLVGIVIIWFVSVIYAILLTGLKSDDPFTQTTINLPFPYFQLQGLFIVGIGPVLEELLMRGYFFEILRKKWNVVIALLITLVFSTILHFRFDVGVIDILIMQTIFTFLYLHGGILSSTLAHALGNYYIVYFVNID